VVIKSYNHASFNIYSCQNELLLDRLVLLCSSVILSNTNIHNACYILSEATHYHAEQLIERLQAYITVNMESFLEGCILDEIPHSLVKQLAKFVRTKQMEKSSFSRSDAFVNEMMEKHAEWLAEQDVPELIIRTNALTISHARASAGSLKKGRSMEKISPSMLGSRIKLSSTESTAGQSITTPQHVLRRLPEADDVFDMDEIDVSFLPPASSSATALSISVPVPAWKASGSTRSVGHLLMIYRAGFGC
jgi:inhibitor of Bruton tyrosine kinase